MSNDTSDTRVVPFVIPANPLSLDLSAQSGPFGRAGSNQQFLEMLFGDQWDQVLVTSFTRDPADPNAPREDWNAWPAGKVLGNPNFDKGNTYFCPSLLTPGTRDRRVDHFRQLNVIIIDDIGTKVSIHDAWHALGVRPTYVIETSPGNYQAGWKIEPETDLAWVKGILVQLSGALWDKADNLTNPVAWRRLPRGFNTKAKLVQDFGPKGWPVGLRKLYPDEMIRRLDWLHIADKIGDITPQTTLAREVGSGAKPDALVLAGDPVYRALETAGYILGEKITSDKHWAVTIRCPWIAEHGPTRPDTGAEYVPVTSDRRGGWFKCFHCENRDHAAFREKLDEALRADGAKIVATFEFEPVDPATIQYATSSAFSADAIDPWDQRAATIWPGGVLPAVLEDTLAELAERDGLDLGALGASLMTAASGAADKRSVLAPYAGSNWTVPPVLWLMLIAEPGLKKTAVLSYALGRLRKLNSDRMNRYVRDIGVWESLPRPQRRMVPPPTVEALLAEDTTIETLQGWMSWSPRGLLCLRDELAGFLEFGRYGSGTGAAARASFLEFYEGGPTTIGRMTRTTVIDNCALSIIGGIQPHRLADELKGLTNDGMLSRFGTLTMAHPGSGDARPVPSTPADTRAIDATIERLLVLGSAVYRTDRAGEGLIRDAEKAGQSLANRPDISVGYRGFLRKLHGTHARASLVLHMLDGGQDQVIPEDTVARAARYAAFLLDHAEGFYGEQLGSSETTTRAIASFILRHPAMDRVTAGQLRRDVAPCKRLRGDKELQDAVWSLVIGGWLRPETHYPNNRSWLVRPGVRDQFAQRLVEETTRTDEIKDKMRWGKQHRL